MDVRRGFIEAGKITPVIDRTYPLSEVREAIRVLAEGRARGKVVITICGADHCSGEETTI
jgi:NADPH:quinone reductase-like Zn-dependent oxidoreductase